MWLSKFTGLFLIAVLLYSCQKGPSQIIARNETDSILVLRVVEVGNQTTFYNDTIKPSSFPSVSVKIPTNAYFDIYINNVILLNNFRMKKRYLYLDFFSD